MLLGAVMMQRVGHTGRLLQDLLGAVIFLIAIIAALAYVLDLQPYPGLRVLISGGAAGIGEVLAAAYLEAGAKVQLLPTVLTTKENVAPFLQQHP